MALFVVSTLCDCLEKRKIRGNDDVLSVNNSIPASSDFHEIVNKGRVLLKNSFVLSTTTWANIQQALLVFYNKSFQDEKKMHLILAVVVAGLAFVLLSFNIGVMCKHSTLEKNRHLRSFRLFLNGASHFGTGAGPWAVFNIISRILMPWAMPSYVAQQLTRYGVATACFSLSGAELTRYLYELGYHLRYHLNIPIPVGNDDDVALLGHQGRSSHPCKFCSSADLTDELCSAEWRLGVA